MTIQTVTDGHATIWHPQAAFDPLDTRVFEPDWLRQSGALTGTSQGRNQAFFLHYAGHDLVLRHFWRGGLVGKVLRDLYLRVPVARSRAMREFLLLDWMRDQGLPVPRPMAARFCPAGLFYRADLITLRIPDSRTFADLLRAGAASPELWGRVGVVIAQMHGLGVDHSDLNCRNILIDGAEQVWLIDFDKCERRAPGPWAGENLARLKRSLDKEQGKVPGLHWGDAGWQALLAGYRSKTPASLGG